MLIDLDLAIVDGERTGGRHMTGTMEIMAIDVLRGVEHTYRHDLESFLYLLLWMCARRAWEREFQCSIRDRPKRNIVSKWYGNNAADVADAKQGFMVADGFKAILEEFAPPFDRVKSLCRNNLCFQNVKATLRLRDYLGLMLLGLGGGREFITTHPTTVPGMSNVCGALVKLKKTPSLQISLLPLYDVPVAIQSILLY